MANKISYEERKKVYISAIEFYGEQTQRMMAIEEMSELTKELCKFGRGKWDMEAMADEIADVTIMLEQLRLMFHDINDMVCERMDEKVLRLKRRMNGEV